MDNRHVDGCAQVKPDKKQTLIKGGAEIYGNTISPQVFSVNFFVSGEQCKNIKHYKCTGHPEKQQLLRCKIIGHQTFGNPIICTKY